MMGLSILWIWYYDSVQLVFWNEGLSLFLPSTDNTVLQFFEMSRHDAIKALDVYKRAGLLVSEHFYPLMSFIFFCGTQKLFLSEVFLTKLF